MTANGVAAWKDLDGDGIATATLNTSGGTPGADSVTTGTIVDGAILDADINAAAGIAVSKLAAGTATYVLTSTAGTAVWSAPASGAPSGAAGGSLTGTYPNPTIATIPSGATATTQTAADGSTKVATTAYVDTADALKANLASPTFTGTPVVPTGTTGTTQSAADSSTKLATTAFVTTADNLKANLAGPTFTGTVTLPSTTVAVTQSASDNSTKPATTAYVDTADALKANLASPTFTGTPTLPTGTVGTTQTIGDNSTKLATTAYVDTRTAGFQLGLHSYSNVNPLTCTAQAAQPNANDIRWIRIVVAETGHLRDVGFYLATASSGANGHIYVLDTGQAGNSADHTQVKCLYVSGNKLLTTTGYITDDPNLAVVAGDTLIIGYAFPDTTAKATIATGAGMVAAAMQQLPTSFNPSSGAGSTLPKTSGTIAAANVPALNGFVTEANLAITLQSAPMMIWRIS